MIDPSLPGRRVIVALWRGTGVFVITAVGAAISPTTLRWPALLVALVLFGIGIVAMLWAFFVAVKRSRFDAIGVGGLYFGAGSAPGVVRHNFMAALGIQVVTGIVTASIRMFTTLAFGTLVPLFAIGLTGLWCARHGTFEPTDPSVPGAVDNSPDAGRAE